jgi:colanic acid/amylovoran biosynthesis glycosyltransferase
VACERAAAVDRFPIANLHRFDREPAWRRFTDRALRRIGARAHLGFLERTARAVGADIVHSHWGDTGWRDVEAVRRAAARHVVSFYGKDLQFLPRQDPRWRDRYLAMFESVALVLCEGPHFAACLRELGCPADRVRIQPLGVDVGSIRFAPRVRKPGSPFRILVAGSFREKKGIPDAIDAAGELARRMTGVGLTVVGDASDDPRSHLEKQRILAAVARHRDHLVVNLLGYRTHDELFREAYEHDAFMAPSRVAADGDTEGGAPVVLLDMAAAGLPIVATRHCDIPSLVQDGESGLLTDEGDVKSLGEALQRLASDPELCARFAKAGRAHVERGFDVHVLGQRLGATYEELAAGGP